MKKKEIIFAVIAVAAAALICAVIFARKNTAGETEQLNSQEDILTEQENTGSVSAEGLKAFLGDLYKTENILPAPEEFNPAAQEIPESVLLDVEEIYQLPELPTGCEITSLTMLLRYYGFEDAEKEIMVDEYLVYANEYVTGFFGDPRSESGAGVYPPGLAATADNFLQAHESKLYVKDLTGSTRDILYAYLAHGDPIVIWNTMYFGDNLPSGIIETYNGQEYEWDYNEHCIVLTGYNLAEGTVTVNDPLEGIVEREADRFFELYEKMGSMAMVLQ